jgi:hypothetical protein
MFIRFFLLFLFPTGRPDLVKLKRSQNEWLRKKGKIGLLGMSSFIFISKTGVGRRDFFAFDIFSEPA